MITILLALATVATDPVTKPDTAATSAPASAAAAVAPTKRERRYCFDDETTGSRISRRTCRTEAAWKELGVKINK